MLHRFSKKLCFCGYFLVIFLSFCVLYVIDISHLFGFFNFFNYSMNEICDLHNLISNLIVIKFSAIFSCVHHDKFKQLIESRVNLKKL